MTSAKPITKPTMSTTPKPASLPVPRQSQHQRRIADRSFNHLLGFTLPPRSSSSTSIPARRSSKRHSPTHPSQDKDRFVHAQYRFILKPTGDYTAHFADSDIRFHWPDILQVVVHVPRPENLNPADHEGPLKSSCPICLSPAAAARMTKCGHVFCYSCLLHYLELSEERKGDGRRCPVCTDPVLKKDLKSVKWVNYESEASQIRFRLVERPSFSTLALPCSSSWPSEEPLQAPWHFTPDALTHARFLLAAPDYMRAELERDLEELEAELAILACWSTSDCQADLGLVFVRAAQAKVREQIEKIALLKTTAVMTARKKALRQLSNCIELDQSGPTRSTEVVSTTDDDEALMLPPPDLSSSTATLRARRNVNPPEPSPAPSCRFYQASSGQHVYLSPLDVRILLNRFGSYSSFPPELVLEVESASEGRLTDSLRRRCKYLSHLAEGTNVRIVETRIDEWLVGDEGSLAAALKLRRVRRKEQARKEERARTKSEAAASAGTSLGHSGLAEVHGSRSGNTSDPAFEEIFGEDSFSGESCRLEEEVEENHERTLPAPLSNTPSGSRTVWGTRLVKVEVEPESDEKDAWAVAIERAAAEEEAGERSMRKNKKKKGRVVINISGGNGGWRG